MILIEERLGMNTFMGVSVIFLDSIVGLLQKPVGIDLKELFTLSVEG